jgi:hypothetical protein
VTAGSRALITEGEWKLVRVSADGLEWSYGWDKAAAIRLRFLLDFSYSTGLCKSEFVTRRFAKSRMGTTAVAGCRWWAVPHLASFLGACAILLAA